MVVEVHPRALAGREGHSRSERGAVGRGRSPVLPGKRLADLGLQVRFQISLLCSRLIVVIPGRLHRTWSDVEGVGSLSHVWGLLLVLLIFTMCGDFLAELGKIILVHSGFNKLLVEVHLEVEQRKPVHCLIAECKDHGEVQKQRRKRSWKDSKNESHDEIECNQLTLTRLSNHVQDAMEDVIDVVGYYVGSSVGEKPQEREQQPDSWSRLSDPGKSSRTHSPK
eukprot:759451-Hanusia_phi.AAC.2